MEDEQLAGQVHLMRWHPVAEEWKNADEPLPDEDAALAQEMLEREEEGARDASRYGEYPWEVVITLGSISETHDFANKLREEGLPVKRRFTHLLVGAPSEDDAIELGKRLEGEAPQGSTVGVRGNPEDMPLPTFVNLAALKPGFLRDLGL
jgi:hypothetical protein